MPDFPASMGFIIKKHTFPDFYRKYMFTEGLKLIIIPVLHTFLQKFQICMFFGHLILSEN